MNCLKNSRLCALGLVALVVCAICLSSRGVADTVRSKWIELPQASVAGSTPQGLLSIPENNFGDLPAVLLIGQCQGPKPFQKTWAHRLASQGYVTFLLYPGLISERQSQCNLGSTIRPLILAAKAYLDGLSDIKIDQMAVVSWRYHLPADLGQVAEKISAAVAFYPRCASAPTLRQSFPQLIFTTDGQEATDCMAGASMANVVGGEIQLRVYPGTRNGFDDPNADDGNNRGEGRYAYNQSAHQDSVIRMETFLNSHLQVTLAQPYPSKAFSPLPPKLDRDETPYVNFGFGDWTHNPTVPGPNRPHIGRSTFDQVFSKPTATGPVYDLPDSYQGVIARISQFVSTDRRGLMPVKQVLIPRGRSLQREAAKPNYYRYPRIVAAVDGEPAETGGDRLLFLKDRLFFGYQETAQVLEVISYNEAAARFEFQVVKNFGPGLKPEIRYADRQLCTSCHQNGAPLFPREEWQETNGSLDTNTELKKYMKRYHGVQVERSGEIPAAIDVATDRANLLPVLQRLWRAGCGDGDDLPANQCRASAFQAMLQYRLSNENSFDRDDPAFKSRYTQRLTNRWRQFWPNGLYISNSDIPDRNPTVDASIFGLRDPLTPRVPMEIWTGFKRSDLERMIVALADDLPDRDIKKLDHWLLSNPALKQEKPIHRDSRCHFVRQLRRGLAYPISVTCTSAGLSFTGALTDWNRPQVRGEIIDIQVDGFDIRDRQKLLQVSSKNKNEKTFSLLLNNNNMRLPNGQRLSEITFILDNKRIVDQASGTVRLTVQDDFRVVRQALAQMTPMEFISKPFHGPKLLSRLFKSLGTDGTDWCCESSSPGPDIAVDETLDTGVAVGAMNVENPQHIFARYCARCHRTHNTVPPNFLFGDKQRVATNLDHCAPRMAFRLSMWDVPVHERTRSPMPPESALPSLGLSKTQWRNSQELATLRRYVDSLLPTERAGVASYDHMQNCLPDPEQARALAE